jgi:hypothetical protein
MSIPTVRQTPYLLPPPQGRKTKWLVIGTLWVALALVVLWSCGKGFYHNYRLSAAAVDHFHRQLNQGDFETIYGDATDEFRRVGTRADEIKFLDTVHQKMGNSGKMSAKGFHISWKNGLQWVDQVYDTQFALGQGRESFVWLIENGQPHLQSYRIDSANFRCNSTRVVF